MSPLRRQARLHSRKKISWKAVQDDAFIEKMVAKYPKLLASLPSKDSGVRYRLEGYLFPATYNYGKDTTVERDDRSDAGGQWIIT